MESKIRTNAGMLDERAPAPAENEKRTGEHVNRAASLLPEGLLEQYPGITKQRDGSTRRSEFVTAFRAATIETDRRASQHHAIAVSVLADIIAIEHPKYMEVAGWLFGKKDGDSPFPDFDHAAPGAARKITSVQYDEGVGETRTETGRSGAPYKQAAQRHYFLARIVAGDDPGKDNPPWPAQITMHGLTYDSPVDALAGGETLYGVYMAYRNAWKVPVQDLTDESDGTLAVSSGSKDKFRGTRKAGESQVDRLFVTARRYDDAKGGEVRARVQISTDRNATIGTVIGLLRSKKFTWRPAEVVQIVNAAGYEIDPDLLVPMVPVEQQPEKKQPKADNN